MAAALEAVDLGGPPPSVSEVLFSARSAWPGIELEDSVFLEFLRAKIPPEMSLERGVQALKTAELYLVCACLLGDSRALASFSAHYLPEIDAALARFQNASLAEDVRHALYGELLVGDSERRPKLSLYGGKGELKSWLRVLAVRRAQDLLRKEKKQRPLEDDELVDLASPEEDQELGYFKRLYREEFKAAFAEALALLESRERNLLRLQLLDGLCADQIAAIYRVHRITVVRWNGQVREKLFLETRRALIRRLKIDPGEFESIARLIHSQMDVSIRRHLRSKSLA